VHPHLRADRFADGEQSMELYICWLVAARSGMLRPQNAPGISS